MDNLNKLIIEWKSLILKEADHFVDDGVICPDGWGQASTKVLFILKETNGYSKSIVDLIKNAVTVFPKSKIWRRPTFHTIGRWAYGLANYPLSVDDYNSATLHRKKALLSCAFINLKKTSGGKVATSAVEANAEKYSTFLRKQIELLNPDIIVFGGTYSIVKKYVLPEMTKVSHRVHTFKDKVCISANHPACRKNHRYMYEQVIGSYHDFKSMEIKG